MRLLDEEEIQRKSINVKKIKRILLFIIVMIIIFCIAIISLIYYRKNNTSTIITYIDDVEVTNFESILDIQDDNIYIPIKEFANYIKSGYKSYNGDYYTKSEEENKCYIIKDGYEVTVFENGSKIIYKNNLQDQSKSYDYCNIDSSVYESDGKLYTSVEGIKKGYNVKVDYNKKNKIIKIYTVDYLIDGYSTFITKKASVTDNLKIYNSVKAETEIFNNRKIVLDDMLIVIADGKYGVISLNDLSWILEPKYDNIEYMPYSTDFLITSNHKYGILTKEGKTKIRPLYEELVLMDKNLELYRVKKGNLYGVIDNKDNTIIYPENKKIGIDINEYSYNEIKNGYILLNKLIPVQQEKKWALYNIEGRMVSKGFIYDDIGCKMNNQDNIYSLLEIPNYNVLVVGQNDKYTVISGNGEEIFPIVLDELYIKRIAGNKEYSMNLNQKSYNIIEYLEKMGIEKQEGKEGN